MLTDCAVASSRAPICSAIDMNRLLKISNRTGSTRVVAPASSARGRARSSSRCPYPVTAARHPSSTTVVAFASATIAGPSTVSPGRSPSRWYRGTGRHPPPVYIRTSTGSTGSPAA